MGSTIPTQHQLDGIGSGAVSSLGGSSTAVGHHHHCGSALDELPKQFVSAMRTLFDIMDDKRTGLVSFEDIEHRWQDDGSKGLPRGVIDTLRKVTPPNGMLSFERFCTGLKICLLRNQQLQHHNPHHYQQQYHQQPSSAANAASTMIRHSGLMSPIASPTTVINNSNHNRPPSAPLLDLDPPSRDNQNLPKAPVWSNVRPNAPPATHRTLSMPQLTPPERLAKEPDSVLPNNAMYGPPKPPRASVPSTNILPSSSSIDKAEIRTALQNWKMGLLMEHEAKTKGYATHTMNRNMGEIQDMGCGGSGNAGGTNTGISIPVGLATGAAPMMHYQKQKSNGRRREPRRHTLQNGIDYNMLKRMKQTEQEKEVLMQGLSAVERARDWYLKQIAVVQEKMKQLGRMGHIEPWSETQQERLELQRARVLEVNRHLAVLTESWERGGLPLHINLAVNHNPHSLDLSERLKRQNRLLTEEVSQKSDRISALEREKASLIQILQMRACRPSNGHEEAVF